MNPSDRDWLELALKAADIGAWYWNDLDNPDALIVRSEQYDPIWGLASGQRWTYRDWERHIYSQDRAALVKKIQAIKDGKQTEYEAEYRILRGDGEIRWLYARGKGIRDHGGKTICIVGVLRDVTETKVLERNYEQMVATLSHDLRNPLSAAKASIELIQKYPDRVRSGADLLDKAVVAMNQVDRLIQDLLDSSIARLGGPLRLRFQDCDLRTVLINAIGDLSIQYGDRFRFESSGDFFGNWSLDALRRVLDNLATNGIKYGRENALVRIRLVRDGNRTVLSVHNEGPAIPPEDQKHLFEPFYRSQSALVNGRQGWGLGLAGVKAIAEALQGRITVESGPEIGTTFTLEFPASLAKAA